jgi:hypothetical protein
MRRSSYFALLAMPAWISTAAAQELLARRPTWNSGIVEASYGVALGDVDRDGDLDLVTAVLGNSTVHLNEGRRLQRSPAWRSSTVDSSYAVALGDIDQDGWLDAVFGGPDGLRFFRGTGLAFEERPSWTTRSVRTNAVALGDVDRDGDLDLVSANDGSSTLFRNTNRVFEDTPSWVLPGGRDASLALGDVDGDDRLDVVLGRWLGRNALFLNLGATFDTTPAWEADSVAATAGIALGDLDTDGFMDVVCANAGTPSCAYRNRDGNLERDAIWRTDLGVNLSSVALGDADLDGDLDVAFGHFAGGINPEGGSFVYLNQGGALSGRPAWESLTEAHTAAVSLGDLDADGDLDLVCGNADEPNFVYDGSQALFGSVSWTATAAARDLALGDVDGDGDLDLVVGNAGSSTALFRNQGGVLGATPIWTTGRVDDTHSVALGDVDGDGDLDLVCGNLTRPNQLWLFDVATGGFGATPAWEAGRAEGTRSVALGDVDSDGDLDLLCGIAGQSYLLPNRNGRFDGAPSWTGDPVLAEPSVAFGDLDRDGWLDVVIASPTGTYSFRNDLGRMSSLPSWMLEFPESTRDIALGDVNGDGYLDLVCANDLESSTVHLNQGAAAGALSFESTSAWLPKVSFGSNAVALGDVDADGDLDILMASYLLNALLYLNTSAGVEDDPAWASADLAMTLASGDVDDDGDLDALVASVPGDVGMFLGRMSPAGGFDPARGIPRLPNEPAQFRGVRVTPTGPTNRHITFTAIDSESDSVWVVAEYQEAGARGWINVVSPGIVPPPLGIARGPFAASPTGVTHGINWDLSTLFAGRYQITLRLRAISHPQFVGVAQVLPLHLTDVGSIEVREPRLALEFTDPFHDSLQLPEVTLGDSTAAHFFIHNDGNDLLRVDSILTTDRSLCIDVRTPFQIEPGRDLRVPVEYAPISQPPDPNRIAIHSNDPDSPALFDVVAPTLDLRVRTQVLSIEDTVRLAQALTIQALPEPGVAIEKATLVLRDRGVAAEWDSIPMAFLPGDSDATSPRLANLDGSQVTEVGLEYFVILENSGITATDPPGAPAGDVYEIEVQPPLEFVATPQETTPAGFLTGRAIDVVVDIPSGAHFIRGTLHWRRGGTTAWFDVPLSFFEFDLFATIPDSGVGERGVEFWVEMTTRTTDLRFPFDGELHPAPIRVLVPSLKETITHPAGRYRMVSVPLDFGGRAPRFDELLVDDFGPYDSRQWRVFRFDTGAMANVELTADLPEFFEAKPGNGFWLVSRGEHRIDTEPLEGLSTSTAGPFLLDIKKGWTQIGNPYPFPIAWSSVGLSDSIAGPVAFDPNAGTAGDYVEDPVAVLQPFEAYFAYNPHARPVTLSFQPIEAARTSKPARIGTPQWSARLVAASGDALDGANRFGIDARATDGRDAFDADDPPPAPGDWVQVAFVSPDGARLRRDVRAPAEGHAWDLEVRSFQRAAEVRVAIADLPPLPSGWTLRLLDLEQGSHVESIEYRLIAFGPERAYRLRLLAGPAAWVERTAAEQLAIPAQFIADRVAPNPFHGAIRFRFGLPHAAPVTLEIFDVRGARVATLAGGAVRPAGYHTHLWNGSDTTGRAAAAGIYFARLRAGDRTATWRLTLLR